MINTTLEPSIQGVISSAKAFLEHARIPSGPFDPGGAWRQTYAFLMASRNRYMGLLHLEKKAVENGGFQLLVDWKLKQETKDYQQVVATIDCADNALATPRGWEIRATTLKQGGQEVIEDLTFEESAKVQNGVIELADGGQRFADQPLGDWTCNWSLYEAIQRLDTPGLKPVNFSVLDFLELRKDGQTLSAMEEGDVILPGGVRHWHALQLIGHGFLPWEYWLDEQHRLVAARTSQYTLFAVEKEQPL